MDQPTTRREKTSSTTAQYTFPSLVGCSVMSVTQRWSGWSRRNWRSTRSSAVAVWGRRAAIAGPLRGDPFQGPDCYPAGCSNSSSFAFKAFSLGFDLAANSPSRNLVLRHQRQVALRTNPTPRLSRRDRVLRVWLDASGRR